MNSRETGYIRIYRKGNGCVLVDPGLAILKGEAPFSIVNTTGEIAIVAYDSVAFAPKSACDPSQAECDNARGKLTLTSFARIASGTAVEFQTKRGPRYFEYEVVLLPSLSCAEGNSKPGGFVDP